MLHAHNEGSPVNFRQGLKEIVNLQNIELGFDCLFRARIGIRIDIFKGYLSGGIALAFQVEISSDGEQVSLEGSSADRAGLHSGPDEGF